MRSDPLDKLAYDVDVARKLITSCHVNTMSAASHAISVDRVSKLEVYCLSLTLLLLFILAIELLPTKSLQDIEMLGAGCVLPLALNGVISPSLQGRWPL